MKNIVSLSFSIQSNLSNKHGKKSKFLNEILEEFWVRPKDEDSAYDEISDLSLTARTINGTLIFDRVIFRRTRNGKRFVWTFIKKDNGRSAGYVAKKLTHKFSKNNDKNKEPQAHSAKFDEWKVLEKEDNLEYDQNTQEKLLEAFKKINKLRDIRPAVDD